MSLSLALTPRGTFCSTGNGKQRQGSGPTKLRLGHGHCPILRSSVGTWPGQRSQSRTVCHFCSRASLVAGQWVPRKVNPLLSGNMKSLSWHQFPAVYSWLCKSSPYLLLGKVCMFTRDLGCSFVVVAALIQMNSAVGLS